MSVVERFYTRFLESVDDGAAIFCGISLLLAAVAEIFSWLGSSGPIFY